MIIKGVCHSEFDQRISNKGSPYGSFYVQAASKIWKVLVFGERVEYAKRHVRIDEKVVVDGKIPEGEEDSVVSAWSLSFPALQKERTWDIKRITKDYREYVETQKALGFVEWRDDTGKSRLVKRDHCVALGKKWLPSIEFAMDVYGPETVKQMLEEMNWRVNTRDVINQVTISAIIKYRNDNPGAVSILKGWEKQVQSNTNSSERDLVSIEEGSGPICGATLDGEAGNDKGAGTTEVV